MLLSSQASAGGYRVEALAEIDSTNSEAMRRAAAGAASRLWIVANAQHAGRGRLSRRWVSPAGNLYASLLLVGEIPPARSAELGFVAGVALAEALAPFLPVGLQPRLKWPNDVLVDGAKLAGILLEGTLLPNGCFACVIGCGVNCVSHPETATYPATSLAALGVAAGPEFVFENLSRDFAAAFDTWREVDGFAAIRARWLAAGHAPGESIAVARGEQRIEGAFRAIDARGRLVLETAGGEQVIDTGDVTASVGRGRASSSESILMADRDELVFVPLGGLGEIGMNAALYGYGPPGRRQFIMVDCGVAFAGPELPGIDLMFANMAFIEKMKGQLKGIVITHAHEDHIGAVPFVWPRFGCPIHMTQFAADLIETRRLSEDGAPDVTIRIQQPGRSFSIGPFAIEMIRVAHSIPEATALAITTPAGTVLHTGDWKIDPTPGIGWAIDEARLRQLGDDGVLALICDSTNMMRDGVSPSERDVAETLRQLVADAPNRVLVTTFASNVARMRAVGLAAKAAGRQVAMAGRSIERVETVARQLGYFDDVPEFLPVDSFGNLPRDKIVILATGSQGEHRAALARIAQDEHPRARLAPGDRVIFSSRPIPGNEKSINAIINGLAKQGVEVITDRDGLVHVSGHPRRSEVERMYEWIRPQIAIPAHGEAMHLAAHAKFARERGVSHVLTPHNGDAVLLSPRPTGHRRSGAARAHLPRRKDRRWRRRPRHS